MTPKTWTGIVHPDVYPRFDKLDETVASMRERLRKGWDMQAFEILWSMSFQEPVYVEVQLKPGSNIRDTQRRVLRSLKASEFYTRQCFTDSPGLVGYASQEAIGKLVKNPEVVGICLDDKPLPDRGRIIRSGSLGPAKPGDTRSELDRAFGLTDRVDVVVSVPRGSLAPITTAPSNVPTQFEVERQAERQVRDRVLSTISADDFWLRGGVGSIMSGSISKEGYRKLQRNPDVLRIELPRLARPLEPRVQASSLAMLRLR